MLSEEDDETPRLEKEPAGVEMDFASGRINSSSVGPIRPDQSTSYVWILDRRRNVYGKQENYCAHDCLAVLFGYFDEFHSGSRFIFAFRCGGKYGSGQRPMQ
jgi:hypothetical protein